MSFGPQSLQARGVGQTARPGEVDYRLVRRHAIDEFRRGRLSRLDVCDAHPELLRAARNVGEARTLLDQAGWGQGPDGMRSKDGRRLVLSVLLSRPADQERAVEVLRSQLTEAGIGLQVQDAPEGVFTQVRRSAFDLFLETRNQDDANPCGLCRLFSIRPGGQLDYAAAVGGGPR
ncbi:MAG: ABC transporter substrate-binding protein, partial [Actinomycetota bacterium]|nr:ABC transporter substrate-binding protein [Actinomycetota bacterium]